MGFNLYKILRNFAHHSVVHCEPKFSNYPLLGLIAEGSYY